MASARIETVQTKRKGTIFRIRYDYVHPTSGARIRPWETLKEGTTLKQAEAAKRKGLAALDEGRTPVATDTTVGKLLEEWLVCDIRNRLEQTTIEGYEGTVNGHLIPAWGEKPLRRLTPAGVQQWEIAYRTNHGYRTVQLCHLRLKQACAYGVRMGHLSRNPLEGVRPPATEAKPPETWTTEQASAFLKVAADDIYAPLWHFLLGTGTRRGEALGLRWSDIDWEAKTARIVQTIRPLHGKPIIKPPKNPQSARLVPLHRGLIVRLKRHRGKQARHKWKMDKAYTDMDLVFASGVGTPINPNNVTRAYDLLIEKCGVERIRIHELRHSAGSLALEAGATLEEIRQLLGHKKISTTADIYVRVGQMAMRTVAESLRKAMGD